MTTITVTTQAEFDAALKKHGKDRYADILIKSPAGVWIEVGGSAGASGSATVTASGSATVTASGSATVRAYDSATVTAYDSATVTASGSATVRASKFVAVHLHSARVTIQGGVVIDVTGLDLDDPQTWIDYTGATVTDGHVTLYKAVDDKYQAGQEYKLTTYTVGADVTATDWRDDNDCGGGLHVSPRPWQALAYRTDATRMLEVTVPVVDIRPIGPDKIKARTVHVVREVTLDGEPLPVAVTK